MLNLNIAWLQQEKISREMLGDYLADPSSVPTDKAELLSLKPREKLESAFADTSWS